MNSAGTQDVGPSSEGDDTDDDNDDDDNVTMIDNVLASQEATGRKVTNESL
jgi:hypothetical protein